MSYFKSLHVHNWRQFKNVEIDLSSKITILTGTNGCGKTSLLTLLSRHFGWSIPFVSSPYVSKKAARKLFKDVRDPKGSTLDEENSNVSVGTIYYNNNGQAQLIIPRIVAANYQITIQNQQALRGLFIPSHRQQSVYNPVAQIPANPIEASQMYEQFRGIFAQVYQSGNRTQKNPGAVQKETIISLAVFGEGNQTVAANQQYVKVLEGFQERLRKVLPPSIGFKKLRIEMPEVVLETATGDFSLDSMSGGVGSIFSIVWQIHMFDFAGGEYTIIIDEPENHLHPSMQKSLLPALSAAFPNARFIVATHSPFILSSFQTSSVFMLSHDDDEGGVVSNKLVDKNFSGSADSVLREILGVESTIPIWVENIIRQQLDETENDEPTIRARKIMKSLNELGIADALSEFNK